MATVTEVLSDPAPPKHELPDEVTAPAMHLLGYATWIATVVFVVGLISAAGLLWWVYLKGSPATATVQKIAWITGCSIFVSSSASIAGFVLQ